MNSIRHARCAAVAAGLFVLAVVWNGLVHLVILRSANASIDHLRRTDLPAGLVLSLLLTAAVCVLFVWGYARIAQTGSLREGVSYGLFMGLFAALLVDLNQYLLYPLPLSLVSKWFVSGVLEFTVYGAVISRAFPLRASGDSGR